VSSILLFPLTSGGPTPHLLHDDISRLSQFATSSQCLVFHGVSDATRVHLVRCSLKAPVTRIDRVKDLLPFCPIDPLYRLRFYQGWVSEVPTVLSSLFRRSFRVGPHLLPSTQDVCICSVHLVGPVTLPVVIWGTISLLLNLGQNPDPQMIMSKAPRDADFALRLRGTYVYRRPHSSTEAPHTSIALSDAAEATVLGYGLLFH